MNPSDFQMPLNFQIAPESLPEVSNPFENLQALALPQNFDAFAGAQKVLTRVPVQKPDRQKFFRVRPGQEWRLLTLILEDKATKEHFLVLPSMREALIAEAAPILLVLCVDRQDDVFFWPVKVPNPDGRANPWTESAWAAVALAERSWTRVASNMGRGSYDVHVATGTWPEPNWPDKSFPELLRLAFQGRTIEGPEHPLVKQLLGA